MGSSKFEVTVRSDITCRVDLAQNPKAIANVPATITKRIIQTLLIVSFPNFTKFKSGDKLSNSNTACQLNSKTGSMCHSRKEFRINNLYKNPKEWSRSAINTSNLFKMLKFHVYQMQMSKPNNYCSQKTSMKRVTQITNCGNKICPMN